MCTGIQHSLCPLILLIGQSILKLVNFGRNGCKLKSLLHPIVLFLLLFGLNRIPSHSFNHCIHPIYLIFVRGRQFLEWRGETSLKLLSLELMQFLFLLHYDCLCSDKFLLQCFNFPIDCINLHLLTADCFFDFFYKIQLLKS